MAGTGERLTKERALGLFREEFAQKTPEEQRDIRAKVLFNPSGKDALIIVPLGETGGWIFRREEVVEEIEKIMGS